MKPALGGWAWGAGLALTGGIEGNDPKSFLWDTPTLYLPSLQEPSLSGHRGKVYSSAEGSRQLWGSSDAGLIRGFVQLRDYLVIFEQGNIQESSDPFQKCQWGPLWSGHKCQRGLIRIPGWRSLQQSAGRKLCSQTPGEMGSHNISLPRAELLRELINLAICSGHF